MTEEIWNITLKKEDGEKVSLNMTPGESLRIDIKHEDEFKRGVTVTLDTLIYMLKHIGISGRDPKLWGEPRLWG